ncbi:hypothetical protein [Sphingorhabdus sp. 109]|jgi:hypothetical protein|uniref:hypothetical protein n=1 Tax=Sphingorhabdus sp. 109 TaxID=2653173 RepID=UPI0012F42B06|nr:hypothetical protein [Sphingorhabdus sp. 109]VWX56121.1 conserved hypothetical protein [Sphingorhabdus sp. 109]
MKNLKFQQLSLLSRREKKARVETFSEFDNAVIGQNDTGKSSFIKSIYAAFGADPAKNNDTWRTAQANILLDFTIDNQAYRILRSGNLFGIFDPDNNLLISGSSVTKVIGPFVAELLDFKLKLSPRFGSPVVPPPAFCFLPFYVDQDSGWQKTWSSFESLQMFTKHADTMSNFHTGIRPKEYYIAKAARDEAQRLLKQLEEERSALERAAKRLEGSRDPMGIALEPELFELRIKALLEKTNTLQEKYDEIKERLGRKSSKRSLVVEEIEITKSALRELDSDFQYTDKVIEDIVVCPTCGTEHQNDFVNRFGLVADADACRTFLSEAREALIKIEKDMNSELARLKTYGDQISEIDEILEEARGEVTLRDMLKDESERLIDGTIKEGFAELDADIRSQQSKIERSEGEMATISNTKRRAGIVDFYADKLAKFVKILDADTLKKRDYKTVNPTIHETGSDLPRAHLAYYYAILHTIKEYSTSCMCPIIIDTPIQQDQDEANAKKMIDFAFSQKPEGAQVILGTVSLHGVKIEDKVISMKTKKSLLSSNAYNLVLEDMDPLLDKLLTAS